jgi:hypothetical protein
MTPEQFKGNACADYFDSVAFPEGIWSERDQLWLILPSAEVFERSGEKFLVIGRPGVDGIEFGYRRELDGVWAYYPFTREFLKLAPNVKSLVEGWNGGTITV